MGFSFRAARPTVLAALACLGACSPRPTGSVAGNVSQVSAPQPATSMTVYRDPVSGRFGPLPPGTAPPGQNRASAPANFGATVAPGEVAAPGGGVMMRLQGRFNTEMTGTVRPDGVAEVSCDRVAGGRP